MTNSAAAEMLCTWVLLCRIHNPGPTTHIWVQYADRVSRQQLSTYQKPLCGFIVQLGAARVASSSGRICSVALLPFSYSGGQKVRAALLTACIALAAIGMLVNDGALTEQPIQSVGAARTPR